MRWDELVGGEEEESSGEEGEIESEKGRKGIRRKAAGQGNWAGLLGVSDPSAHSRGDGWPDPFVAGLSPCPEK